MARIFASVDLLLVPSLRDEILTITNFTGHPVADAARGLRGGGPGAQRLGAGSGAPAADVLTASGGCRTG